MALSSANRNFLPRALALIGVSTFVLTASFVGILALFSGTATAIGNRVPFYLIVMGLAFVGTILLLEEHGTEGRVIIVTAAVTSAVTFVGTTLTAEGVLYAARFPEQVFVSRLVYYFIAAALIGTGIGYWGVNHWREFTGGTSGGI